MRYYRGTVGTRIVSVRGGDRQGLVLQRDRNVNESLANRKPRTYLSRKCSCLFRQGRIHPLTSRISCHSIRLPSLNFIVEFTRKRTWTEAILQAIKEKVSNVFKKKTLSMYIYFCTLRIQFNFFYILYVILEFFIENLLKIHR